MIGCNTIQPKTAPVISAPDKSIDSSIKVGFKVYKKPPKGHYVLIEQNDNKWSVREVSNKVIIGRSKETQEVLYVNLSERYIQPIFEKIKFYNGKTFECTPLIDQKEYYTPCTSNLMSIDAGRSLAKNVMASLTTLGLAAGTHKKLDNKKLLQIVSNSNMFEEINSFEYELQKKLSYKNYLSSYRSASTSRELERFITKYKKNDPDKLVSKAIARKKKALKIEKKRQLEMAAQRKAKEKRRKTLAKAEEKRKNRELASLNKYRNNIRIESETNCGPVLQVKKGLVKIYFPVKNYGNEHWIRKEQIYPSSYNCRFVNGNYIQPRT